MSILFESQKKVSEGEKDEGEDDSLEKPEFGLSVSSGES